MEVGWRMEGIFHNVKKMEEWTNCVIEKFLSQIKEQIGDG
jgi:hypothetical protein